MNQPDVHFGEQRTPIDKQKKYIAAHLIAQTLFELLDLTSDWVFVGTILSLPTTISSKGIGILWISLVFAAITSLVWIYMTFFGQRISFNYYNSFFGRLKSMKNPEKRAKTQEERSDKLKGKWLTTAQSFFIEDLPQIILSVVGSFTFGSFLFSAAVFSVLMSLLSLLYKLTSALLYSTDEEEEEMEVSNIFPESSES